MLKKGTNYIIRFDPQNDGKAGDKIVTRFKISFKVKGSESQWFNIQITDWDNTQLAVNDTIKLIDFDNFMVDEYNGKPVYKMSAKIEKVIV